MKESQKKLPKRKERVRKKEEGKMQRQKQGKRRASAFPARIHPKPE